MRPENRGLDPKADGTVAGMRVGISPGPLILWSSLSLILITFDGLAGYLSEIAALVIPIALICSFAHTFYSMHACTFHQRFSTDHPLKGETVEYELTLVNGGMLPLGRGDCSFADPGPLGSFSKPAEFPVRPEETRIYAADIRCAYRGTYNIGLTSIVFSDLFGILRLEEPIEPRVFYVYPELLRLDPSVEKLAASSGGDRAGETTGEDDPAIFEYIAPMERDRRGKRIAWKYWASRGFPAVITPGRSESAGIRIVLDLWKSAEEADERLPSEDAAASAAFSVIQEMSKRNIPVEFYAGGTPSPVHVLSESDFRTLFDQSPNLIFSETEPPAKAFEWGQSTLLISTRPLTAAADGRAPLFSLFESAIAAGNAPHLLLCPPPCRADSEKENLDALEALAEGMRSAQSEGKIRRLLRIADSRKGTEEIAHALRL